MADILSPSGIESPIGGELHSRAMIVRNYARTNKIAQDLEDAISAKHAEFKGVASMNYPATAPSWGTGLLVVDAGPTHNNSFVTVSTPDCLKILESGLYRFEWILDADKALPAGEISIGNVGGNDYVTIDLKNDSSWHKQVETVAYINKDTVIKFYTIKRGASFIATSRIRVSKMG